MGETIKMPRYVGKKMNQTASKSGIKKYVLKQETQLENIKKNTWDAKIETFTYYKEKR